MQKVTIYLEETIWTFPAHPFVEYEESDERWARPLGFGKEEKVHKAVSYQGHLQCTTSTEHETVIRMYGGPVMFPPED